MIWFGYVADFVCFFSAMGQSNHHEGTPIRELLPRKLTAGNCKSPFWFKECRHFPQALFVSHSRWAAPVQKHTPLHLSSIQHLSAHRQRLLKVLPTRHIGCQSGILSRFSWEMLHRLLQRDAASAEQPSCWRIIANPFHSLLVVTATLPQHVNESVAATVRGVYPHKSHYITWRIFQVIEQQHPSHPR